MRERAGELIDGFVDRGEVDAYLEWCEPLPSSIFLSIMGIPQSQLEGFLAFKNTISRRRVRSLDHAGERGWPAFDATATRGSPPTSTGASEPATTATTDRLAACRPRSTGGGVNRDELHGICNLLMIAGLDTVAASLACILAHLARTPHDREALLADPSKWPMGIEEMMRFESPVTQGFRHVVGRRRAAERHARRPAPTRSCGGRRANVDPEAFDDPLTVDLDRSPNAHICFASGWHRCLGSHLARMELRAALDVWHQPHPRLPHRRRRRARLLRQPEGAAPPAARLVASRHAHDDPEDRALSASGSCTTSST